MKKVFLFAAIAALFAACSSKDELVKDDSTQQPQLEKGAIGFDVYIQKATTRAGWAGSLTTTELQKTDLEPYKVANGFGVFGYYTDNNEYEQRSVPNFMYNQQVTWKSTTPQGWEYNPVVYWPNEYGSNATSDDQDKLTFFAYAPYVKVIPTSGKVARTSPDSQPDNTKELESYGITGMTKNTTQGDPILKYIASFDNTKSVDLCWGVADKGDGAAWNIVQTGNPQTEIKDGMPWIDLERPAGVDQKVRFTFKHATAQMRVSIDADIDVDGRGHDKPLTKKTRIWVREVKFKGFTMKGSLNLNNEDPSIPKWLDYNGQNELVAEDVIVYDGRKDGKEGVAGAVATNEKVLGLNPALIQDGVYMKGDDADDDVYDKDHDVVVYGVDATGATKKETDWERPGVTKTAVNLFRYNNAENKSQKDAINEGNEFFHVIPVNDNFEVEIVYDVETVDANLAQNLSDGATKGSSIENRISKTITFGSDQQLKAGHSYTLALHLGMNSVKFDAAVSEWIDEVAQDVDLPLNTPVFAAQAIGATPEVINVTIPYTGDYTFAITGMHGQETMAVAAGDNTTANGDDSEKTTSGWITGSWSTTTQNKSWTNGTALQTLKATTNPSTIDQTQIATWTGGQSGNFAKFKFTQKAHPLYLTISKMVNNTSNGVITLKRRDTADQETDPTHWTTKSGWICDETGKAITTKTGDNEIKVERNGTVLTWDNTLPNNKSFKFLNTATGTNNYENEITIGEKLQKGDVIKVTIKTGDAPEETVTARYDGMYFVSPSATIQYNQSGYTVPEVKNANGTVHYSSSATSIAEVNSTSGAITAKAPGTAIITATDDFSNTATFTLEVTEQHTIIDDSGLDKTSSATKVVDGEIKSFSTVKIKGDYDDPVGGNISYTITGATFNGASLPNYDTYLKIDGNQLKFKSIGFSATTIVITVKAEGTVTEAAKYEKPDDKTIEITWTQP